MRQNCLTFQTLGIFTGFVLLQFSAGIYAADAPLRPCEVQVVEKGTGWPVPLIELRTTHNVRFVTDNAGRIAFDLPELMGRETWFDVIGQGYEAPKDGFGYSGVRLTPGPGKALKVEVQRRILARRMGRLTGGGLFAESLKLGYPCATRENGIVGCDSTQIAVYDGRLFWVWGDTTLAKYPLGIFNASAATTALNPLKSVTPPLDLPLDYFTTKDGAPRGVADISGEGPTWMSALVTLPDASGAEHLVATYVKIKPPMEAYESGLAVWNKPKETFERFKVIWRKTEGSKKPALIPDGHAVLWTDTEGKSWALFGNPFPVVKFPATYEAWQDPQQWTACDAPKQIQASGTNGAVKPHSGSIGWSQYRKKWVTVFMEAFGKPSTFGELWYAEAASPLGPWSKAAKVLSHEHYTFYNPRLHLEFAPDTPYLFFEGTYTMMFSDGKQPTPRYDYNQVLYRLDLTDKEFQNLRE